MMGTTEELVRQAVGKHGDSREYLLPILQEISQAEGFLSEDSMMEVARLLNLSSADIYGVATFYSFLDTRPRGKNVIRICKTIGCYMKGKDAIIEAIEEKLRIKVGETTPDNKFTLLLTNCIGQCHEGPAMLVNDDIHFRLTPEKAIAVIEQYL